MKRLRSQTLITILSLALVVLYAAPLAALCACPQSEMKCCQGEEPATESSSCCSTETQGTDPAISNAPCHRVLSQAPQNAAPPETSVDVELQPTVLVLNTDTAASLSVVFARPIASSDDSPPGIPLFLAHAVFRL